MDSGASQRWYAFGSYCVCVLQPAALPGTKTVLVVLAVACVNGLGFVLYSYLLSGPYEVSRLGILVNVFAPVVMVVLGFFVLKEPLSTQKVLGILTAVLSIYLLTAK